MSIQHHIAMVWSTDAFSFEKKEKCFNHKKGRNYIPFDLWPKVNEHSNATKGKQNWNNDDHKIEIKISFEICAVNSVMFGACKLCAYGNGTTDTERWSR